jgi:surfeit locus 1 family protein
MTAAALPALIGLGVWQLHRKAWKDELIAAIEVRANAAPANLVNAYSATYEPPFANIGFEYVRAKARGRFHHDKERFYYAPDQQMGPGYHVYTPFEIAGSGAILFVNRGFVSEALKDPATRRKGQLDGDVEIVGLMRGLERQGPFTPDNDLKRNLWFWRDYYGMLRSAFENTERPTLPLFLDAEQSAPGGWPKGGATRLALPNRHLEYALTWLGLAGVLLAVYTTFAFGRWRASGDED